MATPAIYDSALAGIRTAQAGLLATSENVAGANVEGYVRRAPAVKTHSLATNNIDLTGTSFAVEGFSRFFDSHLETQLLAQSAKTTYSKTVSEASAVLDGMLTDSATGLAPAFGAFVNAAGSLVNEPGNIAFRQSLVGAATELATRIRNFSIENNRVQKNALEGIASALNEVNSIAPQLAKINLQIRGASAPGSTPAPEILDERDRLVGEIQELIGGNVRIDGDGTAIISVGGLIVVDKASANAFTDGNGVSPIPSSTGATDLRLKIAETPDGQPVLSPLAMPVKSVIVNNQSISIPGPSFFDSGRVGAYLYLAQDFVPSNKRILNALAATLLYEVNGAKKGVHPQNTIPLFEFRSQNGGAAALDPSNFTGLFTKSAGPPAQYHSFNEVLDITNPESPRFNKNAFDLLSTASDASSFYGVPVLGSVESLDLDRTSAERIEALRASLGNAITTYTSSTATTLASWANEVRANEKLLSSLTTQKESLSGVSLDEEAANLIKYQQVYNASSKVLQVSKQLFDTLLAMLSTT